MEMMIMKQQKKKKGRSVQELIGVRTFTKYGLSTNKGELLFYLVSPTNISVLSHTNIEIKIWNRHIDNETVRAGLLHFWTGLLGKNDCAGV